MDQPLPTPTHASPARRPQPDGWPGEMGVPRVPMINTMGLWTLYSKEVRRFFKVQMQTVWAPAITTLLFLVIFTVALGRSGRTLLGVPFVAFLAPGLIIMGMIQNAFANTSSSVLMGKMQGTIIDVLMPPLSTAELLAGYIAGGVTRAILVGLAVYLAMLLAPNVPVDIAHPWAVAAFGLMGSCLLALLGILTGLWAEKFDHAATVTNFVVQPLSLLSGTFYTLDRLGGVWQTLSHANPFFFMIDGFRYGFIGVADSNVLLGAVVLLSLNLLLAGLCYWMLETGWRIKS